jgi:drug/metabolite transporter (DMT)-like permease
VPELGWLAVFGVTPWGLILFTLGAPLVPAAQTALIRALDARLAPFWVWLAYGETPVRTTLAGGAMVLVVVLWNILGGRERLADVLADRPETV